MSWKRVIFTKMCTSTRASTKISHNQLSQNKAARQTRQAVVVNRCAHVTANILSVATNRTNIPRQVVHAINQSILMRCLCITITRTAFDIIECVCVLLISKNLYKVFQFFLLFHGVESCKGLHSGWLQRYP